MKSIKSNPQVIDSVHHYFMKGINYKDIARKIGISRVTVERIVHQERSKHPDKWLRKKHRQTPIYNAKGKMIYDPEFHPNHGKPFTEEEKEYMCKFHEIDGFQSIGYALGRTTVAIRDMIKWLKKNGLYEYYKHLNKHYCGTAS
ncbi:helix-turn-helix domain-containing protein [Risungbinella massiliensis]|uniref:helix-turn-helix domain-containing protein n=1 Tax=Risungbinella massiliensis TaxID=1329796 RepID=UPI00069C8372|nr:helix-turn-helix domain-containing protein [Risungbinella massiliensis]